MSGQRCSPLPSAIPAEEASQLRNAAIFLPPPRGAVDHVRFLIGERQVRDAIPLHGSRELHRVARCDRLERTAAPRELDKLEGAVAKAVGLVRAGRSVGPHEHRYHNQRR